MSVGRPKKKKIDTNNLTKMDVVLFILLSFITFVWMRVYVCEWVSSAFFIYFNVLPKRNLNKNEVYFTNQIHAIRYTILSFVLRYIWFSYDASSFSPLFLYLISLSVAFCCAQSTKHEYTHTDLCVFEIIYPFCNIRLNIYRFFLPFLLHDYLFPHSFP